MTGFGVNVQVQCITCKGTGQIEQHTPDSKDHFCYRMIPCSTCRGFGVLIATELKRIERWAPLPIDEVRGVCRGCNSQVPSGFYVCDGSGSHPAVQAQKDNSVP